MARSSARTILALDPEFAARTQVDQAANPEARPRFLALRGRKAAAERRHVVIDLARQAATTLLAGDCERVLFAQHNNALPLVVCDLAGASSVSCHRSDLHA